MLKFGLIALSVAAVTVATGCSKTTTAPPTQSSSKSTDQIMREDPKLKSTVVDSRVAEVQKSNLPEAEKQRIIAKLRAEGPPQ